MNTNAALDREVIELDAKRSKQKSRIKLMPFDSISISSARRYLVKGVVPYPGLTVIWGPPKSGKSFWTLDLAMHVALGRGYRGKRVHRGRWSIAALKARAASLRVWRRSGSASCLRMPSTCPFIYSPLLWT